jgi:hypothetical protein
MVASRKEAKMKNTVLSLLLLLLGASACKTQRDRLRFKNRTDSTVLHGQMALNNHKIVAEHLAGQSDAVENQFQMLIYPKGKFSFDATQGFVGEAWQVALLGKQSSQKQQLERQRQLKENNAQATSWQLSQLKKEAKLDASNTKRESWGVAAWHQVILWGGLLLCAIMVYRFYRKKWFG